MGEVLDDTTKNAKVRKGEDQEFNFTEPITGGALSAIDTFEFRLEAQQSGDPLPDHMQQGILPTCPHPSLPGSDV